MVIGERVKELRELRGMSQVTLGKASDTDSSYISRLERGVRVNPGVETVHKLAAALDTSMGYLLGETDDPRPIRLREEAAHDHSRLFDAHTNPDPEDILDLERAIREADEIIQRIRRTKDRTD